VRDESSAETRPPQEADAVTTDALEAASTDQLVGGARGDLFVVGVGASAGGLEALQQFFAAMPRTGRLAFVVVQHLSPDFKSLMTELLAPHTALAVQRAADGMTVQADCVYLLPPKREMTISGGKLSLTERDPSRGLSLPIDSFLRSLAEDLGPRAIGIILSGTGSDGSRGIRPIHQAGGIVLTQSEESAQFSGMPRSAVDTGLVDRVLSPAEMPNLLVRYVQNDGILSEKAELNVAGDALGRIFELLRRESGVDFSDYKASTVGRRIERRLLLSDSQTLERYVQRLAEDPSELRLLYKDLLIGVTRFFRDADAFDRLASTALPDLIDRIGPEDELRAWVPACATGEEAYSLAMLLFEAFRQKGRPPLFRVFATDVHRHSLETASIGIFSADAVESVPRDLRERYFVAHPDGFQVSGDLRGRIVFAHHNVMRDAPFTRLDLLSCRNLLIYFKPDTQRRVLALFHFALRPGGVVFLGPSESTGPLGEEFSTIDARWKIFRKARDVRIPPDVRPSNNGDRSARPLLSSHLGEDQRVVRVRELLLDRYAPPTILIDAAGRILHTFNRATEFLTPRDGKPSLNLLDQLHGELRFVVAGALKRAEREGKIITSSTTNAQTPKELRKVRVAVQRLDRTERMEECYAITFEPERPEAAIFPDHARAPVGDLLEERLSSVEDELRLTKENLQASIEEMETSNEELQATNEELIASNEELQSTNEELHSVNEELYTVNGEYQAKIAELTEMTSDMNHLFEAAEIHTLFLDRELRLRKFTPRIARTFNLLPQDVGRRLDVFAPGLSDAQLIPDVERVARTGQPIERQVDDRQGRTFFLRILPYLKDGVVDGVVVTFIDIGAIKRAERDLARSEERYRALVRSVSAILFTANEKGLFATPQAEWTAYTGHNWDVHQGDGWLTAVHPDDRAEIQAAWRTSITEKLAFEATGRLYSKDSGDYRYFVARAAPLLDEAGEVREWVGHVIDVHETKVNELQGRRKDEQLRSILDHSPAFIWVKDLSGRYVVAGRQCQAVLGRPCEEVIGKTDHELLPGPSADALRESERRVLDAGETVESEEMVPVDGELRTFLTVKFPLRDERMSIYAVAGISTDITERKRQAEVIRAGVERRDQFLAMLSHELRTPLGAILNAADLIERGGPQGRPSSFAQDVIRRQTRHMAKLIDDLLDVGRITRDQLVLESRRVDLRAVIEEALEVLRPEAERKGIELRVTMPREEIPVSGDAVRLRQVFTNLGANAITYTPNGRVTIDARMTGDAAVVTVKDTGIGMREDELSRIFELFYQTPQPLDRQRGGLGVGLTLALKLVHLHGGELVAASEGIGKGSTFTVTLKLTETPREEMAPREAARPHGKLRIVVVEDNQDIRDTLEDLLRLDGHEVISAKEGISGAERIVEYCPDVAIVDVGLPGMDGYAVAKAVRAARGQNIRLIALTGYGRREDRIEAAQAGFDRHLVKPIDHEVLSQALAELLSQRPIDA
jgi:two-component system, chemotaxis family, CheB/CheR fusion protein